MRFAFDRERRRSICPSFATCQCAIEKRIEHTNNKHTTWTHEFLYETRCSPLQNRYRSAIKRERIDGFPPSNRLEGCWSSSAVHSLAVYAHRLCTDHLCRKMRNTRFKAAQQTFIRLQKAHTKKRRARVVRSSILKHTKSNSRSCSILRVIRLTRTIILASRLNGFFGSRDAFGTRFCDRFCRGKNQL